MDSVATISRRLTSETVRRLSPADRVRLALRLGDDDVATYMKARGLDRETAARRLQQRRQSTRRRSVCVERLLG